MNKSLTIILLLLVPIIFVSLTQDTVNDKNLRSIVSRYGQATVTIPLPPRGAIDVLTRHVSISSLKDKRLEIVLSPLTVEWFISQKYNYSIVQDDEAKGIIMAADTKQAMEWESYPTYTQYDSIMQSFATLYSNICHLDTIGTTNYGKLVLALKISDNPLDDEGEPETFYTSSIHGNETGGYILMLRLADYLLKYYYTDTRARNLVDNLEIWINPLSNPDGTYRTGNTISSPTRYNANGYDLNRNFPDPVSDDPVKQVETLDMIKFMKAHNFVLSANFHAGEEVVNYPWDRWQRRHPDDEWFYHISRRYADTVHLHSAAGYMTFLDNGVTNGYDWYDIYGGRQDYVTWELYGREVTIELDYSKVTPASELNALWEYNWRSLFGYLENALYGVHGTVTDFFTGEAVPAKIVVTGHDADSSHIYSDTLTGGFVRFLAPGTWSLTFTADGYMEKSVSVMVENEQKTEIEVKMVPFLNPIDTVETLSLHIYPNPSDHLVKVVLPERQIGNVSISIYNPLGVRIYYDNSETTFEDVALYVDIQKLPDGIYTLVITNTSTKVTDKAKFIVLHRK